MFRVEESGSVQTDHGQILILEEDAHVCEPYLGLARLTDRAHRYAGLNEIAESQSAGSPWLILLSAAGQSLSVLDRWRDLFALDVPVMIIHAPDPAFVLEALRRGAQECLLVDTQPEIVALQLRRVWERERERTAMQALVRDLTLTERVQGDFLRVISHDLKGQITNLRIAIHLLYDMVVDAADAREIFDNADLAISEIQNMIHTFLDAAPYPGMIAVHIECVRAADTVQRVLRQHMLNAAYRRISLNASGANVRVQADPQLLLHVIGNLVGNAIKFTPDGGWIEVRTEVLNGQIVRISVIDNGPGILPEERGKLFRPFARISSQPVDGQTGTGLGLWIVKYLTEMQHGTVGAHFPAEGGSIFYVDLPLCNRDA